MRKAIFYLLVSIGFLAGLGLLLLTNSGWLTLRKPYLVRKSAELSPQQTVTAFVNVNVVPMDGERILAQQTVIVRDGLIEQVDGSGDVHVPDGAQIIDGAGQYLMPGLVDMHVHVKEENELLLFVAYGVTTVRDMWGTTGVQLQMGFPDQLKLRAQIQDGELFGPTLYTAGPVMEGNPPTMPLMAVVASPAEAAESVAWQKAQGYDFIKVYDHLDAATYQAVLESAEGHGLPVIGHVPKAVDLAGALAGGQQSIEHLSGFIDPDTAEFLIPEDKLDHFAAATRDAGAWVCPTIGVYQMYVRDEDLPELEARPEMTYVSPRMRFLWKRLFRPGAMQNISYQGDYPARIDEIFTHTTRVLHENGAKIILGTDTDNPYLVPGASLLDELDYLVKAGFTPYEAIEAGTRVAAEALGREAEFGTVIEGKRADLLLVAGNPLEDVANVRQRSGVMVRGRWLTETELREMLDELATSYVSTLADRLWPAGLLVLASMLVLRRRFRGKG